MKMLLAFINTLIILSSARSNSPKKAGNTRRNLLTGIAALNAPVNLFPFMASITLPPPAVGPPVTGAHSCGGSILRKSSPAVIATAASCDVSTQDSVTLNADGIGRSLPINSAITSIAVNPGYNPLTYENDIALVFINLDISANPDVEEITYVPVSPGSECCTTGDDLQVLGYGSLADNPGNQLQYLDVSYVDEKKCQKRYDPFSITIYDDMMCAECKKGGFADGDYGGPLMRPNTNEQVGIVSFGGDYGSRSYPDTPGVYTEIGAYNDWICAKLNSAPPPPPPPLAVCNEYDPLYDSFKGDIKCGQTKSGTIGPNEAVIYKFVVSGNQCAIGADTCGSNFDTGLTLMDSVGTILKCNDDLEGSCGPNGEGSGIGKPVPSATPTEYWLKVEGHGADSGYYELKLDCFDCDAPPPPPPGGNCVSSCKGKPDGDYQSCNGCDVYVTCSWGYMYDNRPCAPNTPPLQWDDNLKRCEFESNTCQP